jgi:hypothetical protein
MSVTGLAADDDHGFGGFEFRQDTLVLSRSVYVGNAETVSVGQNLPPGCTAGTVAVPPLAGGTASVKVACGTATADGTVNIYAVTSTVSASGDQGADPNKLVRVTDLLKATTLPAGKGDHDHDALGHFVTVRSAKAGEVLRGIAFAPYEHGGDDDH